MVTTAVKDTKSVSFFKLEPFIPTDLTYDFLLFDHIPSWFLFLASKGGQKGWLLTFSLHCSCSSTSQLFISRFRLVYWPTMKIANDLRIFASYYAFFIVSLTWLAYFLSYLSWLSLLYKFTRFFLSFLFLSDEEPMLETLDYPIRIGSTRTNLYFDLYHTNIFFLIWTM